MINYTLRRCMCTFLRTRGMLLNNQTYSTTPNVKELTLDNPAFCKYLKNLLNGYEASANAGSQEHTDMLQPAAASVIKEIFQVRKDIYETDGLIKDTQSADELIKLAKSEKEDLNSRLAKLEEKLFEVILPAESSYEGDILLEVVAGVGGLEAMLFTKEIFDMYCNYAKYRGWKTELYEYEESDIGGLRHSSIAISGRGVYNALKYESGVHRVQRVPKTEKSGRVHTSTMTVAILPQPSSIELVINPKDLKIETKKASGPGGQGVNTTDSAIRIVHLPTGIVVECQTERAQYLNKEKALRRLEAKLYKLQLDKQDLEMRTTRKLQVGTSGRSEKIRTYNFSQDRITDHRLNINFHHLEDFFTGTQNFDEVVKQLQEYDRKEQILELVTTTENRIEIK